MAREKNVAPSSISRSIATLERELGVRLFNRTTRRLSPTEAGQIFFLKVEQLVDELRDASEAVRDVGSHAAGNMKILAPAGFAQVNILPLLPELLAQYPLLTFEFVLTTEDINLVSQRFDLAIRYWPLPESSYIAHRLCALNMVVCATPGYLEKAPIPDIAALQGRPSVVLNRAAQEPQWHFRDREGHVTSTTMSPLCIVSNALALKECALQGLGPAIIPRWMVGAELAAGTLVQILPQYEASMTEFNDAAAWLVYPSRAYLPLKVRVVIDFLRARFKRGAPGERAAP